MMTAPCSAARGRRYFAAAITMLLLVLTMPTAAADPVDGPTRLTATATVGADFVGKVSGRLLDQEGQPIPAAQVFARLNDNDPAEILTDSDGRFQFSFTLNASQAAQPQQVNVSYEGADGLEASQFSTTIGLAPASEAPGASADARAATVLTVSTAASTVSAGGLVIIEGTLTDQNQVPVPSARIRVTVDENESTDSLVVTDDAGAFQTFAEIPAERAAGEASLVVTFAGNNGYTATTQELALVVDRIPVANASSPEVEATDVAGDAEPSASSAASAPSDEAEQGTVTTDLENNGILEWFYVALIVVGGAALLTAAGLIFRNMYWRRGRNSARDAGSLDLIMGDEEPDDSLNPEGDASEGAEERPAQDASGASTPTEPPRRGLD